MLIIFLIFASPPISDYASYADKLVAASSSLDNAEIVDESFGSFILISKLLYCSSVIDF